RCRLKSFPLSSARIVDVEMGIDKSRENHGIAELVHLGDSRYLIGSHDGANFSIADAIAHLIAHYDRCRTNSIRRRDPTRNKSVRVHARAYRACPPFSTFPDCQTVVRLLSD